MPLNTLRIKLVHDTSLQAASIVLC